MVPGGARLGAVEKQYHPIQAVVMRWWLSKPGKQHKPQPRRDSFAAIPLTAGFVAKFYLFTAGIDAARWLLVSVLVIGSAIGLFYFLRIIVMLTRPAAAPATTASIRLTDGIVLGLLCVLLTPRFNRIDRPFRVFDPGAGAPYLAAPSDTDVAVLSRLDIDRTGLRAHSAARFTRLE